MPIITALSASGREGRPASPGEVRGALRADGADLRDADTGATVRLVGASWHGAEGAARVPNGLSERNYKDMMNQMVEAGLNSIRLPVSPAVLWDDPITDHVDFSRNPSLRGLTAIEVIDAIVEHAGRIGLRVVIDMHRRDPGVGKQEDGLWFDEDYALSDLARDWQAIASRYADDPTVVGYDLFNEPSGRGAARAHWSEADRPAASDWAAAAEHLGDAVLAVNPDALIFVQGVHVYDDRWYWVGGNLKGARERPIDLAVDDRLVYSPHDYPASVRDVPWLRDADAREMRRLFAEHWGHLHEEGIAPVVIGETGGRLEAPRDAAYMDALFAYLEERAAASPGGEGGVGLWWWSWNPNSGDTGGLLEDDWRTPIPEKLAYVERVAGPLMPISEAAAARVAGDVLIFELEMTRNIHVERVFHYEVEGGTAEAGVDFVADTGVVVFEPGETRAAVEVTILPDTEVEGAETVRLSLAFAGGKPAAEVVGVIEDRRPPAPSPPEPPLPATPDATATLGLGAHRLDVAVTGDAAEGFAVSALLARHDGSAVGPWDLRVAPAVEGALRVGAPEGDLVFERRAGDAVLISSAGGGAEDEAARIDFDVQVLDEPAGPLGIRWEARGGLGGAGAARAAGPGSDTGGALDVAFDVVESWGDGRFHARVTLTNAGERALEAWIVEVGAEGFAFDRSDVARGVDAWDLRDGGVAVASPSWDDDLGAGESFTFGITGHRGPGAGTPLDAEALLSQMDFFLV